MSKAPKFYRGMRGYASLLAAVRDVGGAATALAEHIQSSPEFVRAVLRQLHVLKLIHIGGWLPSRADGYGTFTASWTFGPGVDAVPPLSQKGKPLSNLRSERPRLGVEMMAFADVFRLLGGEPVSIPELAAASDVHRDALRRLLRHMRSLRLARIAAWDQDVSIEPVALYALGSKRDVDRPKRTPHAEVLRQYRERRSALSRQINLLHTTPQPFDLMTTQLAGAA